MPRRKRKAIGQLQPQAQKEKQRRRRETPEERERRLAVQRESMSKCRASETQQQREARLRNNRERTSEARARRREQQKRAARQLGMRERPAVPGPEQRKGRVFLSEVNVQEELLEGVNREIDTYAECLICEDYPVSVKIEETAPDGDYPDENDPLYISEDESDPLYIRDDEADITQLQHRSTVPDVSPTETLRGDGVGEAPVGIEEEEEGGEAAPDPGLGGGGGAPTAGVSAEVALRRCTKSGEDGFPEWVIQQRKREQAPRYGVPKTNLLAAYEGKQMVCPACRRSFLGVSALQHHVATQHDGRVGPRHPPKGRSSAVQSSVSEKSGAPLGQPPASAARVAGTGSDPSECGEAVASSVPDTSADSPPGPSRPHCRKLLAGEEAHSEATPGFAPPVAVPGCSEKGAGLKTQISTVLGGLLGRVFASLREKELCRREVTPASGLSPSLSSSLRRRGRSQTLYSPQLAERARRQLTADLPPAPGRRRYACLYCESRCELQCSRNRHTRHEHRYEIISPVRTQAESEDDPEYASGDEESPAAVHEYPLIISRSDDSQEDADLKFEVVATENNVHEDPLIISRSDDSKEDPDVKFGLAATENNVHEDPLVISKSDDSKEDTDLKFGVISTENTF